MREGLESYVEMEKRAALEQFRHEQSLFVAGGMKKAPKLPPILRRSKGK